MTTCDLLTQVRRLVPAAFAAATLDDGAVGGWSDPRSRWRRAATRRLHRRLLGLAIVLILILIFCSGMLIRAIRDAGPWLTIPDVIGLTILSGVAAFVGYLAMAQRRLARRIVTQDGLICPRCTGDLARNDEGAVRIASSASDPPVVAGTPASSDNANAGRGSAVCGAIACGHTWHLGEVVRAWEQWTFDRRWFKAWRQGKPAATIGPGRRTGDWVWACVLLLILLDDWTPALFPGGSPLQALFDSSGRLFWLGVALYCIGRPLRSGESRHCAECDYARVAGEDEMALHPRCPECNAEWNRPGASVHGDINARPGIRTGGIFLMVLSAALIAANIGTLIVSVAAPATTAAPVTTSLRRTVPDGRADRSSGPDPPASQGRDARRDRSAQVGVATAALRYTPAVQ